MPRIELETDNDREEVLLQVVEALLKRLGGEVKLDKAEIEEVAKDQRGIAMLIDQAEESILIRMGEEEYVTE